LAEGAFHPEMTVCFLGDKPASVYKESVLPFGKTVTYDLSLPESLLNESPYAQEYSDTSLSLLLPERSPIAHKGTYGKLSVFAGCSRYRGAASIATKAAYLSGVGLVELNSCEEALSSASVFVPEAIFRSFPSPNDVLDSIHKSTAVLAGCGLEQSSFTNEMIESLVSKCKVPLVLDAEALNVVSSNPEMLHGRPGDTILTPHLGEFSRLSGIKTDLIREDRIGYALQFAERYGIYLVLKSENTVIATPDGRFWIDKGGSSGLAKAGSGDLLAGLIAGYVSSDLSSEQAAIAGVLTHSGSSLITEQDTGIRAMTATEVLNHVPRYLAKIN
ncbi:MAG: NAD(P)H-hydrate dehydratase, partial [Oscillospiraceae bacterium]|nr:NAD(P)H-hydrate dehydratase [Oscillospiraceae bacterium]